jgi:hypothetical protein
MQNYEYGPAVQRAALKRETDHEAQATFTVERALTTFNIVRGLHALD